ncbi:MAG: T9SS type A sorting domain-containing protein [Ignavibacteriaceae bacterium]|nr:T9SS type A sorting domain-containing protein [Ignavibacteriaceae bacterium]
MKLKSLLSNLCFYMIITGAGYELEAQSDFIIYPGTSTQTETFITRHPLNEQILFASANTIKFQPSFFISEGVYVSEDGGLTWSGSDTCKGPNIAFHGGDPGIAIDKSGRFILTRLGRVPLSGLYSHYSDDKGVTWSSGYTITTEDLERATVVTDGFANSPYSGRTYASWVRFAPPYPVALTYTTNGGVSWITPKIVNSQPISRSSGGDMTVGSDGRIYVTWANVTSSSPFTETNIGFAVSADGGDSWTVIEGSMPLNGIQGILFEKQNIRVNSTPRIDIDNSGGPYNGRLYIVTTQKNLAPAGSDPDIILYRSTDGGTTWLPALRVNQDPLNNGKIQFFPAIYTDKNGGVNIVYYDDRGTSSDSTGVWLSRSLDGGETFSDYQISDRNFKPIPIGGLGQGYQGDNIDITGSGDHLLPVWMSNASGIYQIWSKRIPLSAVPVKEGEYDSASPAGFSLAQNYPNPFNPSTVISFSLGSPGSISLTIYDIMGNLVKTAASGYYSTGEHQVRVDLSDLNISSGTYFYTLRTQAGSITRKMVVMR